MHLAIMHAFADVVGLDGAGDLLERVEITSSTLATSFVLLNQTNSSRDLQVEREGVVSHFLDRLCRVEDGLHYFVDPHLLLVHGDDLLLWRIVLGLLLFALLFLGLLLFLFLSASVALNLVLEHDVDRDLVVLPKVARHWDLNH